MNAPKRDDSLYGMATWPITGMPPVIQACVTGLARRPYRRPMQRPI